MILAKVYVWFYFCVDNLNEAADPKVDDVTSSRVAHYLDSKAKSGFDLTSSIKSKKDFGNPYILQKVIDYYKIDEVSR